jgi:ATP-binding protein involved in chromosome partitioning
MNLSESNVLKALGRVMDPDLKKDLVSLGMIQQVRIEGKKVTFTLVLTTPACPLKSKLKQDCIDAIRKDVDEQAEVEVEFSSTVTTRRKETETMMKGVKNIIAVASGKGGVGKSTVAANLALALYKSGADVGLVDADIYGPSLPIMFNVQDERPTSITREGREMILPVTRYGIQVQSIGFFVDPGQALIWRGPMASNALIQLFRDTDWGELDYLVVDLPPGTGDIHLTLVQNVPVTGVAIVSTPQEVALIDARKAIAMFRQESINVPVLGLIENMSWFTPRELPGNKYYIFGKEGTRKLAEQSRLPLLGQIPIVQSICESGDMGMPAVLEEGSMVSQAFMDLASRVAQQVAVRNATMSQTKVVAIKTQ